MKPPYKLIKTPFPHVFFQKKEPAPTGRRGCRPESRSSGELGQDENSAGLGQVRFNWIRVINYHR